MLGPAGQHQRQDRPPGLPRQAAPAHRPGGPHPVGRAGRRDHGPAQHTQAQGQDVLLVEGGPDDDRAEGQPERRRCDPGQPRARLRPHPADKRARRQQRAQQAEQAPAPEVQPPQFERLRVEHVEQRRVERRDKVLGAEGRIGVTALRQQPRRVQDDALVEVDLPGEGDHVGAVGSEKPQPAQHQDRRHQDQCRQQDGPQRARRHRAIIPVAHGRRQGGARCHQPPALSPKGDG